MKIFSLVLVTLVLFGCSESKNEADMESHKNTVHTAAQHEKMPASHGNIDLTTDKDIQIQEKHPSIKDKPKVKRTIVVPDEVKKKWKSIKLVILDKIHNKAEEKIVKTGDTFKIEGTDINVEVGAFLPHMTLGEDVITTISNELQNPSVNLIITEKGKELYNGWTYSKFPEMYSFQDSRYSISLVDFYTSNS